MLAPRLNAALPQRRAALLKTKRFVLIGRSVLPKFKTKKNRSKDSRSRMGLYAFAEKSNAD